MFKEICTLIQTLTGLTIGSSLQVGHRAQKAPDRCTLVGEAGGGETNFYCPDMANLNIQIITRAKTYFQARDDAWLAYFFLHGTSGWNMPNTGSGPDYLAMTVEAMTTPQYIGQDENGRFEFSTNYIFRCEEGSCS
uniref:Tail protein n=1 Tax=viral metagenome TaxID=1070528 RepID=A0A6M3M3E4_9ZZZZ